jgi:uncharacterized protein YndB with AHSA1/START domain
MTESTERSEGHTVVRLQRTIPAEPAKVYRAWLDPELLRQWMAPGSLSVTRAEVDERPGGRFRIWQADAGRDAGGFDAELLELIPDRKLVFRWGFVGPPRETGPRFDSLLTITFDAAGGGTLLTLTHERLDTLAAAMPEVADQVEAGWGLALDNLTNLMEVRL